jgi:ubiquinone/menaquinone biosynthesis C-methylase UbiE
MDKYRDQKYLLKSQYKDATNFGARVALHTRFRVNPYGFSRWAFDHFKLDEESKLLELGCGLGGLWDSNWERVPVNWHITLTDFSAGMLQEARKLLGEERFAYEVADAQKLPFADASFDAVIANHMLYHIPDLPRALGEIRRVLKPSGHFYATTFGRKHMRELDELVWRLWPNSPWQGVGKTSPFVLENGQKQLTPFFAQVTLDAYEDALEVTEAEPLAAYAFSLSLGSLLSQLPPLESRGLASGIHRSSAYRCRRAALASLAETSEPEGSGATDKCPEVAQSCRTIIVLITIFLAPMRSACSV